MGSNFWVSNASPIILLAKADCIDLMSQIAGSVIIPFAVKKEIGTKEDGIAILETLEKDDCFQFKEDLEAPANLLAWDLGLGENQVIIYSYRYGAKRAILDDLEGRRCAKVMGVPVIGTLGLVARAKHLGLVNLVYPRIERLRQCGLYASDELVNWILSEVNE